MPEYTYSKAVTRPISAYVKRFWEKLGRDFVSGEWIACDEGSTTNNIVTNILGTETEAQVGAALDAVTPYVIVGLSDKPIGPDGIPEAQGDGADVHTVTIYKKNYVTGQTAPGSDVVRTIPGQMIAVNPRLTALVDGVGRVSVGPVSLSGTIRLEFRDQAGDMMTGYLTVRFI